MISANGSTTAPAVEKPNNKPSKPARMLNNTIAKIPSTKNRMPYATIFSNMVAILSCLGFAAMPLFSVFNAALRFCTSIFSPRNSIFSVSVEALGSMAHSTMYSIMSVGNMATQKDARSSSLMILKNIMPIKGKAKNRRTQLTDTFT
ncbi:hypothetical protein D3C86_1616520 [compost metagenome]